MEASLETLRQQENPTPKPLNALAIQIHGANQKAGWWEPDKIRRPAEIHMLIVTEVAEATEEIRKQTPPVYANTDAGIQPVSDMLLTELAKPTFQDERFKLEGELIELADAMIRILDYCAFNEWDIDSAVRAKFEYNKTRSHRHGGKAL